MDNKKLNILFIPYGQFPDGGAFINRLLGYAKGLEKEGHFIHFILLSKQQNEMFNSEDLIKYSNSILLDNSLWKGIKENKTKLLKLINYFIIINRLKRYLLNNVNKFDIAYTYGMTFPFTHLIGKYCKFINIKVINEQTEFPFIISSRTIIKRLYMNFFIKNISVYFDGLVVISNTLKQYFSAKLPPTFPIKVINILVEYERFVNLKESLNLHDLGDYIAYAGRMNGDKDGVVSLIKSFNLIHNEFPNYKLVLIGDTSDKEVMQPILSSINKEIRDKVVFTGKVSRKMIPSYLVNAKLLCLARPNTIQAKGGFPTKLGEYLASGNPTVITNTGEITNFLIDGVNAFIAESNEPNVFAQKIDEALSDLNNATIVGIRGKKLVYNEFSYITQTRKLVDFMMKLIKES